MNYLDRNEFNYEPSELVKDAFKQFDVEKLCFYTRIYDQGKKSIFSVYLSDLFGIEESRIILGYGGEDILKQFVHFHLTKPGSNRTVFIPKFSWWYYKSIADEVCGKSVLYPLYEDGDTFRYDFDALSHMLAEQQPAALVLASPNNPTGNSLTPEEMDRLLNSVPETTAVIVDEAYASFITADNTYIKRLTDSHPRLLILRTLSKFYGLPGLRMGFGFMGEGLADFSRYGNKYLGYNRISEQIAIAAIKSDAHYREVARQMNASRHMYEDEIGALPGFKVYKSAANFILIKYPIRLKEALQQAFAQEDYKVKFMNEPDLNTHLRITLGRPEQNRVVADTLLKIARQ
jgi:histidinol-phosphate aminotransferase